MKLTFKLFKLFIAFSIFSVNAQVYNPISWSTSVEKTKEGEIELISTATIQKGWHLYSQHINEGGPIPTTFYYPKNTKLIGETREGKGIELHDPIFEMPIKYFGEQAVFRQKVKVLKDITVIKASVEYMSCNDEMCLPPKEVKLVFDLSNIKNASVTSIDTNPTKDRGYFMLFLLSFLAGLSALFTPCVFPMIPMTVSFFTKQSKTRLKGIINALFYGVSIVVIYVVIALGLVWSTGDANILYVVSSSPIFNFIFFVLIAFFAFSLLGFYELVLPSKWSTKLDNEADKGGFYGIFFMALALAVVSFSCTGPIVGAALVESVSIGGYAPVISMLGFSLAIALPFTMFAIFPGWMNSLPKSGGWLNVVKSVLGFLELALALKFLSNTDLVLQAHLLERELFIILWILISVLMAAYLLGFISLHHEKTNIRKVGITRIILAIVSLLFAVYMTLGLFGRPLKVVSAYIPPQSYSMMLRLKKSETKEVKNTKEPHFFYPYKIVAFEDYDAGLAYAKKHNKKVLLDFTGRTCVNCRKMEEQVWSSPEILKILENDIVLISLPVDDRTRLENEEISSKTGMPYKYIGQKWGEFQVDRYKTNALPYYVILNADGEDLNTPVGYTPNADEYLQWLEKGVQ